MKNHTITTFNRALASVLLISQLLTSCGGTEIIVPTPEIEAREPIARERTPEESVNRRPSSSGYWFYGYCHLRDGLVKKLENPSEIERFNGLNLPLCVYNPSLKVLQEVAQVQEQDLARYQREVNDFQVKLAQHETDLRHKTEELEKHKGMLQVTKNDLEHSNKVLEEKQRALSQAQGNLQTIEQQLLDEEKARKEAEEQLKALQQENVAITSQTKAYKEKNNKMRAALLQDLKKDLLDENLSEEEISELRTQIQTLEAEDVQYADEDK